jgi:hypothetical protein
MNFSYRTSSVKFLKFACGFTGAFHPNVKDNSGHFVSYAWLCLPAVRDPSGERLLLISLPKK